MLHFRRRQTERAYSDTVTGIAWMVVASAVAVSTHAMIRHVAETGMHPFEVTFFYNLFTLPIILPLVLQGGTSVLRTRRHGLMFARASMHLASMLLFFFGLTLMPLATASALTFLAPLFAVLLAAIFLKEGFSTRRVLALLMGFAGMLIIVRPDPGDLDANALVLVGAALLWGAVLVVIKVLSRTESSSTITVWMALMMAPMAFLPALPFWTTPTLLQLGWLALAGILGAFAQWATGPGAQGRIDQRRHAYRFPETGVGRGYRPCRVRRVSGRLYVAGRNRDLRVFDVARLARGPGRAQGC